MNLLVVDCYDSFTFNLVHYLEKLSSKVDCIRNDKIDIAYLNSYDGIILSPGPGLPNETKNLYRILEVWAPKKPILGICLGHQAIGTFYGLDLVNMPHVHHGIELSTIVTDNSEVLFKGVNQKFNSGRYHSWVLTQPNENSSIKVTAVDEENMIMGISHKEYNIKGVQFHPESILTNSGLKILENWVNSI